MNRQQNNQCAISGCPGKLLEGIHVFRFPKEHHRWLQWVKASGRLDLEVKGSQYSYRNIRLCSLHFEEKWIKRSKVKVLLHPDAIPTKFGKDVEISLKQIQMTTAEKKEKIRTAHKNIQDQMYDQGQEKETEKMENMNIDEESIQEKISMDTTEKLHDNLQSSQAVLSSDMDVNMEIAQP
ncbi:52 kDa repressor of the inhibitor of the protein kinase-like, partial [Pseudomyrmex gracilis]|uniref:52 kDa repressor of the inhibitor of the protein kinase-like n=1 Tax=Pseudomyrmex gracilis TaxID=219809 RepID=UPI000994CE03